MSGLLAGIGGRIADRWLQSVLLSGLLWVATLLAAVRLGQRHPFDVGRLGSWLDRLADHRAGHSPAAVLLAVAAGLLAAGAAGLAAGALGELLQRLWGAEGVRAPLCWLARWRWRRRRRRTERDRRAVARAAGIGVAARLARGAAASAVRRRAVPAPTRRETGPTRVGELLRGAAVRVRARHGLDLEVVWPRLWAVLPDTLRADLTGARAAYTSAARLAGWALLYAAVAVWWWPAALLGAGLLVAAAARARTAAAVLAVLAETAVDLHLRDVAERLGVPADGAAGALGRAVAGRLAGS